jgi:Mrp family chromosome partitioning ATPase
MSIAPAASSPQQYTETADAAPRVRHQARDAATLMVFSAATSLGVAAVFLLLAVAARQA